MIEFLRIVEQNPFLLYYYAFSLIISILLGRLFLIGMGHQRLWNYFFSILLFLMSVIGMFSLVMMFYQLFTGALTLSLYDIGVPFAAMIISIWLIRKKVSIPMLTGLNHGLAFFGMLFVLILTLFLLDYNMKWMVSGLPVSLFLLLLIGLTILLQFLVRFFLGRYKNK